MTDNRRQYERSHRRAQGKSGSPAAIVIMILGVIAIAALTILHSNPPRPKRRARKKTTDNRNKRAEKQDDILAGLPPEACAEIRKLIARVPSFRVVPLGAYAGNVRLDLSKSLTVDDLRGKVLDDDPPILGKAPAYDPRQSDTFKPGTAPYEAKDIKPFRFRYFNCEFNYGGWHNFKMTDYASAHGFNIIYPYIRRFSEGKHLPRGTLWLGWSGFINWHKWFGAHGLPEGRYDLLMDRALVAMHLREGIFRRKPDSDLIKFNGDLLMIDMEHPVLSPEKLREQDWYPRNAPEDERKAFESRYYAGYGMTYISSVRAARKQGWKNISVYGWYPYGRTWGGLEQVEADPGTDFAWNAFGKQVFDEVDIVNNSVYCFYWTPENVAYVLANIDMNIKMTGNRKPVRPYYWTLLHGGGGGWRWWREQPMASEDARAMFAMGFFTGFDGFDTWNWSGTGNHHRPSLYRTVKVRNAKTGKMESTREMLDVMVGRPFSCRSDKGEAHDFRRYDVLHITRVDLLSGKAVFQLIDKSAFGSKHYGVRPDCPFYSMDSRELIQHLRPKSEPVAAMIEGMALVKPFEYILRHGRVRIDVPGQKQFAGRLPIVRRVKLGRLHVIITYDPNPVYGTRPKGEEHAPARGEPRWIVLDDFDGVKGRRLKIPADTQTRVFVVVEG